MTADKVADWIGRQADDASELGLQQAVVTAIVGPPEVGSVSLLLSGATIAVAGVAYLESYLLPRVGDSVWVIRNGPDRIVLGRVAIGTRPAPTVTPPNPANGASVTTGTATFLSLTFVAEGDTAYKATMNWSGVFGTVVGDVMRMFLDDPDDATLAAQIQNLQRINVAGSVVHGGGSYTTVWMPEVGEHTINWNYNRSAGTGTVALYGPGSSLTLERFDI